MAFRDFAQSDIDYLLDNGVQPDDEDEPMIRLDNGNLLSGASGWFHEMTPEGRHVCWHSTRRTVTLREMAARINADHAAKVARKAEANADPFAEIIR